MIRFLAVLTLFIASPSWAWLPHGAGAPATLPFPLSYYATFANGPPAVASFFPLGVWHEVPNQVGGYSGSHANLAAAAAAMGLNFFNVIPNWPASFGSDTGELAAIKSANMYTVGGKFVDYSSGTTATSVPSILALAAADGALKNVIGYSLGDEPACGASPGQAGDIPTEVADIKAFDATRFIAFNFGLWVAANNSGCPSQFSTAALALTHNSYDLYPVADPPGQAACLNNMTGVQSDFISVPNDCIWIEGVGVRNLLTYAPNEPVWVILESGSNILGDSVNYNSFVGTVTLNSNVLVNGNSGSGAGATLFTSAWVGLAIHDVGCISGGLTVLSVTDSTHLVLNGNATCTATNENLFIQGGPNGNGCLSNNLCLPNGNQFRATPASVNGEAWNALISGAYGIIWFCHDSTSATFCLGDAAGGSAATAAQVNLAYINGVITTYAPKLNASAAGACSMQATNYTVSSSCSNGILTMATSNSSVPGLAMLRSLSGVYYLFAMSDRNSAAGASMTFTVTGAAGKTATVVYDSNSQYDNANNNVGATFTLNGSAQFADTFGAHGDHYQVRIYAIQ